MVGGCGREVRGVGYGVKRVLVSGRYLLQAGHKGGSGLGVSRVAYRAGEGNRGYGRYILIRLTGDQLDLGLELPLALHPSIGSSICNHRPLLLVGSDCLGGFRESKGVSPYGSCKISRISHA